MTQESFLSFIEPLQERLFRFALKFFRNREEAKDLVQDAIVKLWQKREHLEKAGNKEAWCFTVVKNLILDRKKYNNYRVTDQLENNCETNGFFINISESNDVIRQVKRIISNLPHKQQVLIHLKDIEGFSYNEIETIMNLNNGEVKTGLFRARKAIREQLIQLDSYGL
ncbi:MAG TPA: RNA polymerase sigma factor [Segetibacter sp.]|jgi:RNA polymerase sigma-70 factor (ECF subfamily)